MNSFVTKLAVLATFSWTTAVAAEMLPGSEWGPVSLNAEAFAPEAEVFLRFEQDNRYFGNGGCNTFRGAFVTNENAILFSPAATTMMACPEPVAQQEYTFLQTLMSVRSFKRDGTEISLFDSEGTEVLALQQRDAD